MLDNIIDIKISFERIIIGFWRGCSIMSLLLMIKLDIAALSNIPITDLFEYIGLSL